MADPTPLLTADLAERLTKLLGDQGAAIHDAQAFARAARELGVGIVDIGRNRAWVDERVHEGVLIRMRETERALAELQGITGGEDR